MSAEVTPMEVDNDQASSGAMCICGNPECENSLDQTQLEGLPLFTRQHKRRLHGALKSQDCGTVCQLQLSGMQFCTSTEEDNCYSHIVKCCTPSFLDSALKMNPEAVNVRGPGGLTLLMLCDSVEKLQILLKYGPDLDAVNREGETALLHFVKHTLKDVAQRIIASFSQLLNNIEFTNDDEDLDHKNKVQNMVDGCKMMLQCIVQSGVNINAEDTWGRTALQVVLNSFKSGYVFHKYHYDTTLSTRFMADLHIDRICTIENEIAAQALATLLRAESVIPGANEHGTTALIFACLSPWNIDNIQLLVQQGVDVNEEDDYGHNAIHYLLKSFVDHYCDIECLNFSDLKAATVDKILCFLLDSGCELQGTDILMFDPANEWFIDYEEFPVLVHFMLLKDSYLNKRDFPGKQTLKNSQETCVFL